MPTKAAPAGQSVAKEEAAAAVNDVAAKLSAEAQKVFGEAARRIEMAVQEGLTQLRAQSRVYADQAGQGLDQGAEYVSEQVRARPLAAVGAALGVGVIIGMLLGSSRR